MIGLLWKTTKQACLNQILNWIESFLVGWVPWTHFTDNFSCTIHITTNFCRSPDNTAVMSCEKFCTIRCVEISIEFELWEKSHVQDGYLKRSELLCWVMVELQLSVYFLWSVWVFWRTLAGPPWRPIGAPHLSLTSELWDVYFEYFGGNLQQI